MSIFIYKNCCLHSDLRNQKAAGRPRILLHGLGASSEQFARMVADVEASTPVLMIDLPGHAENVPTRDGPVGFEVFTNAIAALCDDLGLKAAVVGGISMGGALGLRLASVRPDLVSRLVVSRPAWFTDPAPANLSIVDRLGTALAADGPAAALAVLEASPLYNDMLADTPLAAQSLRATVLRLHAVEHAPVLPAMVRDAPFSAPSQLKEITCPAVVVGSRADELHPVALAQLTANALSNAELKFLPPRYLEPDAHQAALASLIFGHGKGDAP